MRFAVAFCILVAAIFSLVSTHPRPFKEKNCGKSIMIRFLALCPTGASTDDPRQLYFATLMCGVGFTDEQIQQMMCPEQIGQ